jgi:hypothetical protein
VHFATDAPADDAPGGSYGGPLTFGQIGRKLQDRLDWLMAIETVAPWIEAELLDFVQLLQTVTFDGFIHGDLDLR